MSRLVARLILAMLLLPLTGALLLLFVFIVLAGKPPSPGGLCAMWAVAYAFIAAYWIVIWRDVIRWTRRRIVATAISGPMALAAGTLVGAVVFGAMRNTGAPHVAFLVGGGLPPILWVLATVLIWRESPRERIERLSAAGKHTACCPICGYNMTGLRESRCPECGGQFSLDQLISAQPHNDAAQLPPD